MTADDGPDPRARRTWRIGGLGTAVLGPVFAAVVAVTGADGRVGLAFFLLGTSLACAVATLYAVGTGAADAFRGGRIGRSRVIGAVVLGLASVLSLVMVLGLTSA